MNPRLALLGLFIAALPVSVEVPARNDGAQGHETRVAVAGDISRFALVQRGCEGQVLDVVHGQLKSGAIEVEHEFPNDLVLGVRGGNVHEEIPTARSYDGPPFDARTIERDNHYVNPYVAFETRYAGAGLGWLKADHGFLIAEYELVHPDVTGHIRFGDWRRNFAVRWMEDLPLESAGYLTMETSLPVSHNGELTVFTGMVGPYDGALLGLKGRIWLTPDAALQVRAALGAHSQYTVGAGGSLRFGGR